MNCASLQGTCLPGYCFFFASFGQYNIFIFIIKYIHFKINFLIKKLILFFKIKNNLPLVKLTDYFYLYIIKEFKLLRHERKSQHRTDPTLFKQV